MKSIEKGELVRRHARFGEYVPQTGGSNRVLRSLRDKNTPTFTPKEKTNKEVSNRKRDTRQKSFMQVLGKNGERLDFLKILAQRTVIIT